jgi:L-fucose isomerase
MASDRFGTLPKIGIRPTIDARQGGVRESLEEQTMRLARALADLISGELRYPNGDPVECVIADSTIGRVAEAAAAAEKFRREGVGVTISVTPAWCYGSETMDTEPLRPTAVWGFNGTERPGAVYLAAVLAAHNQKGLPAFGIYGRDVQDAGDMRVPHDVRAKVLRFVKAALGTQVVRGRSYLSVGGTSMGIAGSIVDHAFFQRYLGMRVEAVDMSELLRRIERGIYDRDEYERAMAWVRRRCTEGRDYNHPDRQRSRAELDADWEISVKMALAMRDLMVGNPALRESGYLEESLGHNAILAGFQGQRQWTDQLPNGDFMEAILNSSFDWDGPRAPYLVATENDALNGVSMLFGHLLTNTAQLFADVRTYWSPEAVLRVAGHGLGGRAAGGFLHLINSGPAALDATGQQQRDGHPAIKPYWEVAEDEIERALAATTWHPGLTEYFRGGGWSTRFRTRGDMPVTMSRLNLYAGLGPALQIAEGRTIELPDEVHTILDERTNPTWPTTWFAPRTGSEGVFRDVYSVMNAWGANHAAISYGHIGADLITLASMLRIPVFMHNVPAAQILRPAAWNGFGTSDPEGADFRACAAFGPLYD